MGCTRPFFFKGRGAGGGGGLDSESSDIAHVYCKKHIIIIIYCTDGRIYLNLSKSIQNAAGLKTLKSLLPMDRYT